MQNNPVMESIQAAFQMEIANQFTVKDDTLVLTLPDQSRLVIGANPITPTKHTQPNTPTAKHTYHYVHQHDFGYGNADEHQPLQRLLLRNMEDCRSYLDDVCQTLLDAAFHDFEITFPDGSAYLLTVDPA